MHPTAEFLASRKRHLINKQRVVRERIIEREQSLLKTTDPNLRASLSATIRAKALMIDQIKQALKRLDNGTYGTCQDCGKSIPRVRLKHLPEAATCVRCPKGGARAEARR